MVQQVMSDRLLLQVWTKCTEGSSALGLFQAIAESANEQGNCYLPIAYLAAAARMSRKNAFRALRRLREDRWIVTSRILGQGGRLVIQINLPKLARSARPTHDEVVLRQRCRQTEATLVSRVSLRPAEGQNGPPVSTPVDGEFAAMLKHWQAGALSDAAGVIAPSSHL